MKKMLFLLKTRKLKNVYKKGHQIKLPKKHTKKLFLLKTRTLQNFHNKKILFQLKTRKLKNVCKKSHQAMLPKKHTKQVISTNQKCQRQRPDDNHHHHPDRRLFVYPICQLLPSTCYWGNYLQPTSSYYTCNVILISYFSISLCQ